MHNKKFLGVIKEGIKYSDQTYITKHSWNCGWYWEFGYLSNSGSHWHIDNILHLTKDELFDYTRLTANQWDTIRYLFMHAYALRRKADSFHGNNPEKNKYLNSNLEQTLNQIWGMVPRQLKKNKSKHYLNLATYIK